MKSTTLFCLPALALTLGACGSKPKADSPGATVATADTALSLPAPYTTKSVSHYSNIVGWPDGKTPVAPAGFRVTEFARELESPRSIYVAPNGDVFVSDASTERNGIKKQVVSVVSGQSKPDHTG